MVRTFCGKTWDQMNEVLDTLIDLEDKYENMTEAEKDAFDIALYCITAVMNRMIDNDNRPIEFD